MIRNCALLAATVSAGVIELTNANFDSTMSEQPSTEGWFVEFFAPWCGHCKALAPIWEDFANNYAGEVNVGSVDCTTSKDTCTRFGVTGYPTLIYFPAGETFTVPFVGARDVETF